MVYARVIHLMLRLFVTGRGFSLLHLIQTNDRTDRARSAGGPETHYPDLWRTQFLPVHRHLTVKLVVEIQRHPRSLTLFWSTVSVFANILILFTSCHSVPRHRKCFFISHLDFCGLKLHFWMSCAMRLTPPMLKRPIQILMPIFFMLSNNVKPLNRY